MKLVESLEREGGHILMLWIVICYALFIMAITLDPMVKQICHDIVVGGFSALLALLKGTKQQNTNP